MNLEVLLQLLGDQMEQLVDRGGALVAGVQRLGALQVEVQVAWVALGPWNFKQAKGNDTIPGWTGL